MASAAMSQVNVPQPGPQLIDMIAAHGSASHPYVASATLLSGPDAARNLADAIHFLCALHGRYPGVIELVATRTVEPTARAWLAEASEAFSIERSYLAALVVKAGPQPATPGAGSESAVAMQRNAILTLSQSERRGCAIGAALAVAGDWAAIRPVLDAAAVRFGGEVPRPWTLARSIGDVADIVGADLALRRAMIFGGEQVAVQHRGLWDLLDARALARKGF